MTPSPLITIVIPTYNRAHLITKTLDSVMAQTFQDFEVIIVDDGSTDGTEEAVARFLNNKVRYARKQNGERGAARNFGAKLAQGAYINFFDSDDLMYPNHLQVAALLIESEQRPEFFHLAYDYKSPEGEVLSIVNKFDRSIEQMLLFDNGLSCNGVFLRKDIIRRFPFEESRMLASSEDWALWIKLICRFNIITSNIVTSSVVNHDQRSLFVIAAEKVIKRDLLLIDILANDPIVIKQYGSTFDKFKAERYTFFMLCFSQQKQRRNVWHWGFKAFKTYPKIIFSKRFLASIKNSLKP